MHDPNAPNAVGTPVTIHSAGTSLLAAQRQFIALRDKAGRSEAGRCLANAVTRLQEATMWAAEARRLEEDK